MENISRRSFLHKSTAGLLTLGSGCVRPTDPTDTPSDSPNRPPHNCDNSSRPTPEALDSATVEALEYPSPPDEFTDQNTIQFIKEYETAYRRNKLLEEHGEALRSQSTSVYRVEQFDSPESAFIIRLQTRFSYTAVLEDEQTRVHADSPFVFVTYYVDDAVMIRAAATRHEIDKDEMEPDPYESGRTVECFQQS